MNTPPIDVVVTRHQALVDYLIEQEIIDANTPVLEHVTAEQIAGKNVLGVLPHHLSSQANTITEVPMDLTMEDRQAMQRGDLPLKRVREVAGDLVTYRVRRTTGVRRAKRVIATSLKFEKTSRGSIITRFLDRYRQPCSLQMSSLATEACVWLGVTTRTDLNTGEPLPDSENFRMHLSQEMVRDLLGPLQWFADHGTLPRPTKELRTVRDEGNP